MNVHKFGPILENSPEIQKLRYEIDKEQLNKKYEGEEEKTRKRTHLQPASAIWRRNSLARYHLK